MSSLVLGVDIDGICADFNKSFATLIFQQTGKVVTLPPLTWDYAKDQAGVTNEENRLLEQTIKEGEFWRHLSPLASSEEFRRLNDLQYHPRGVDVYFITSRPGTYAKGQTEEWLEEMGIESPTVLLAPLGPKGECLKGHLAKGLGLTHFLDDKPENCYAVREDSPTTKVSLFDASYNQTWNRTWLENPIERVFSVTEWLDNVEELDGVSRRAA